MPHASNPFRNDPHPDLTRAISEIVAPKPATKPTPTTKPDDKHGKYGVKKEKGEKMAESHSRAELEKLGVARLRELKKKYEGLVAKGNRDASRELADIRGLLRSKGGGHALDEASACERGAMERLKAANAEDLKEKPGAAGKAAHRRLHKSIAGVVGEGVDATPKNPYRFGSMSAGDVAARSGPGKGAQGRLKARLKGKQGKYEGKGKKGEMAESAPTSPNGKVLKNTK